MEFFPKKNASYNESYRKYSKKEYYSYMSELDNNPISYVGEVTNLYKVLKTNVHPNEQPEWHPEYFSILLKFFQNLTRPYRMNVDIPFQEPLHSEVKKFLVALDAYYESSNPCQDENELFILAASGPSGSVKQKRIKMASFLYMIQGVLLETNEDLKNIPVYKIKDIGDIFNFNYMINWKMIDEEDYKEGLIDCKPTIYYLDKFRSQCSAILAELEEIEIIEPESILMKLSGSTCLTKELIPKRSKVWKEKGKTQFFAKKMGTVERCVIQTGPASQRDTVICPVDVMNRINWIDQQVLEIVKRHSLSLQTTSERAFEKRLSRNKKYSYYLMRDIKKEGITKPRILLQIMLEELKKRYPEAKAFEFPNFFNSFSLKINDKEIFPERGHGLGMANSLTTLMQIVIFELCCNSEDVEGRSINDKTKCLTLNDDFLGLFSSREDLETYLDIEDKILPGLGIIISKTKSFFSENGNVIAERYFVKTLPYIDKKESYHRREVLNSLCACNIIQAKQILNSAIRRENLPYVSEYIKEIIQNWGYEFFPEEYKYPYSCGGWMTSNFEGCSLDLVRLNELPYNNKICRAYNASQILSINLFKRNNDKIISPVEQLFKNTIIPDEFKKIYNILTITEVKEKYGRFDEGKLRNLYYHRLYKKRQKIFLEEESMPFDKFCKKIIQNHPTKTFYPLKFMIKKFERADIILGETDEIYLSRNPLISGLMKFNNFINTDEIAETFSLKFTEKDSGTLQSCSGDRKRLTELLHPIGYSLLIGEVPKGYVGFTREFSECYINPHALSRIAQVIELSGVIPIIFDEWKSPLIPEKKEIYGTLFSADEEAFLSRISTRKVRKYYVDKILNGLCRTNFLEFMEVIENQLQQNEKDSFQQSEKIEEKKNEKEEEVDFAPTYANFWIWKYDQKEVGFPTNVIFNALNQLMVMKTILPTLETYKNFGDRDITAPPVDTGEEWAMHVLGSVYSDVIHYHRLIIRLYKEYLGKSNSDNALDFCEGLGDLFG
jgi:hypothetical protein